MWTTSALVTCGATITRTVTSRGHPLPPDQRRSGQNRDSCNMAHAGRVALTEPGEKRSMKKNNKELSESTKLVHDERYAEGAVAPPIYQTSLFSFEDYQSMVDRYRGDSDQAIYSRIDNPTTRVLQDKIAMLEGGDAAAAFSSGMAAISNTILSVAHAGDRIVCIRQDLRSWCPCRRLFSPRQRELLPG